ncbi:hypothetical protein [Marinobacter salicampi]|uniref:hypothetical protein n=1 Tax=Marinobacter salicampi TaxID=435907 RepID=UPI00140CE80B|nr:hypothetical protein [Marinobacter salicampi]
MREVVPACGGTEPISVINGRRWQYVFEPSTGRHGYLDVDNDLITWHRLFHPAHCPELEMCSEPPLPERWEAIKQPEEQSLYW